MLAACKKHQGSRLSQVFHHMGSSLNWIPSSVLCIRVPYHTGDLKRDPNLDNTLHHNGGLDPETRSPEAPTLETQALQPHKSGS